MGKRVSLDQKRLQKQSIMRPVLNSALILDYINEAFIALDTQDRIMYCNKQAEYYLRRQLTDLEGKRIWDEYPRLQGEFLNQVEKAKRTGEEVTFLYYYSLMDIWFNVRVHWTDVGTLLYYNDVTKRVRAEERVKQERERLDSLLGNVPGVVWEMQTDNLHIARLDFISHYVETMLGYSVDEWFSSGQLWYTVIYPEDRNRVIEDLERAISSGQGGVSRFRWVAKTERVIWVESHFDVIKDSQHHTVGLRGVTMDISDRMELERRKDEFISMASHELKTPVTTIKGFTQILSHYFKNNDRARYFLHKMDTQIDRLTVLINDLLDVSRIQSGKLELHREMFIVDNLVSDIVEDLQQTTSHHRIVIEGGTNRYVFADKYRVSQVIINLISNAIKFSPRADQIIVKINQDNQFIGVSVQDFGIGISNRHKPHVFDRFFQADNTIRQSFSGLGLGLYISSEIVQRHGGSIDVESEKGKGSTFSFRLPIAKG